MFSLLQLRLFLRHDVRVLMFTCVSATADGGNDLMNVMICQRSGSGNFDQTGIPRRTTPFVRIQKSVPGVAL